MWLVEGLVAGLIAGIFMGIATEIGYRLGLLKANLVIVDGSFALRLMNRSESNVAIYILGIVIHLVTSAVFGIVYVILAKLFSFDTKLILAIVIYVFILWIAMLFVALPVAGQGTMGKKISGIVWVEQLVLHVVFGLGFWWALGLI
jgi:uncharacterized membrane protein YagU involved in acid resistance